MVVPTTYPKSKSKAKRAYLIVGLVLVFTSFILFSLKLTFQIFDRHIGYGFVCFLVAIGVISKSYDDQPRAKSSDFGSDEYIIRSKEKDD